MTPKKYKKLSLDAITMLGYANNVEDILRQYGKQGYFDNKVVLKKKKKKYEDKRDWRATNQRLVKRGEFYINPRFLETWLDEIKELNAGKVGNPYFYPQSLIEFVAILHEKGFDVRSLEGILHGLSKRMGNFRYCLN